jgi:type I restriction enzyme, S subunit
MVDKEKQIPQGYKDTKVGLIPEGWDCVKLGDIGEMFSGGTPSTQKQEYWKGTIPWVSSSDVLEDKIFQISASRHITQQAITDSATKLVPPHNILIVCRVGVGKVAVNNMAVCTSQDFQSLIVNKKISKVEFVAYILYSLLKRLAIQNQGTAIKGVLKSDLIKLKIPLPPLPEQEGIARVLGCWDRGIDVLGRLITAKKKQKKALMQQLLTGKRRFKEFQGQQWNFVKAGDLFRSFSKKNNNGEILLSATQENGVIPRDMLEGRVTMPEGSTNSYKLVVPGDFIISLRSFQGGLEYSKYRGIVSPAYTVLKPKMKIDDSFYKHYFKSYIFIGHLAVAVIGIRDGKQISYGDFAFLKLPYPIIEEQQKIAAVLNAADREIELLEKRLEALNKQKKGLMQKLLTGRVRLTTITN